MNKYTKIGLVVFAAMFCCVASHAALIAYEGFDYAEGNIENKNGGTGFSSAWGLVTGETHIADDVVTGTIDAGSDITHSSAGRYGQVKFNGQGYGIGRSLTNAQGTDGNTVWMSFLTQNNNTSSDEEHAVIFTTDSGSHSVRIGATRRVGGQSLDDGEFELASMVNDTYADIADRDTDNNFVVLKFEFGASDNDTVTAWWNPDSTSDFDSTGSGQVSGFDASFDGIGFTAKNATLKWDEIYIGTELSDVTLVPEPATFGLLGIFGLLYLLRRRLNG